MTNDFLNCIFNLNNDVKNIIYDYFISFQVIHKKKIVNHVKLYFELKELIPKFYSIDNNILYEFKYDFPYPHIEDNNNDINYIYDSDDNEDDY